MLLSCKVFVVRFLLDLLMHTKYLEAILCVGFDAKQMLAGWQRLLPKSGKALVAFVKPECSFLYLESGLEKVYLKSGLE